MKTLYQELTIDRTVVEQKLQNGYEFDIGSYLSSGWEIYKKEWLTFSIYALLVLIILTIVSITIIGLLFTAYPLMLGFFIGANKVENGESLSIGDMFGGFKKLPQLAILTLIPVLVMILVSLPFGGIWMGMSSISGDGGSMSEGVAMGSVFLMYGIMFIVGMVMSLALFFAPYLVFFGDYSAIEALKTSWKLSLKQPLMIVLFVILISLIAQIGSFLCLIGVFASMGFAYVCYYPAIKDVLFTGKLIRDENTLH